jgi:hypothetical protein
MSDQTSRPSRAFTWNSAEQGKEEYADFYAILTQSMLDKSYVLDEAKHAMFLPEELGAAPARNAEAAVKDAYRKEKVAYNASMVKVYMHFEFGISTLRNLLVYPSAARADLEAALRCPVETDAATWTPIKQLKAALDKIKTTYSRSNAADTDTLRRELQSLTDQIPGGFVVYQKEFNRILSQLQSTGNANIVTAAELREWVKKGIKNPDVIRTAMYPLIRANADVTYLELFAGITDFLSLSTLTDTDPYAIANTGRGQVSAHAASSNGKRSNFPGFSSADEKSGGGAFFSDTCTRCWGSGHSWRNCFSRSCVACKRPLDRSDKTCGNWKSHNTPFRFRGDKVPWERSEEQAAKRVRFDDASKDISSHYQPSSRGRSGQTPAERTTEDKAKRSAYFASRRRSKQARAAAASTDN